MKINGSTGLAAKPGRLTLSALKHGLFRGRDDGDAPIVLGQRRIFILPTRAGYLFALTLVVMLVGAINYNLALGHALVFLLAGVGLVGMIHTFRNLLGLSLAGGRPEPVFAGEIAHFPLHLVNNRPEPRLALEFRVRVGKTSAKEAPAPLLCHLAADSQAEVSLPVAALRRGWLTLPRLRLESRYPLGFFVAWTTLRPALRCLVYPRPLDRPLPPAQPAAGHEQGAAAGREDFAGLRQRQPADSPRHVAWKAAARDGGERPLLVKEFAGGARAELRLDWASLPADWDEETRLSALTGWVLAAEAAGAAYGLALPGVGYPPASGEAHRRRCLEALALYGVS